MSSGVQNAVLAAALAAGILVLVAPAGTAVAGSGLGPRIGLGEGDELFIGAQAEFGRVLGAATMVPSLDLKTGDDGVTAANFDFRWYLLPLPETGLKIYGAAGPTAVLSPGSELGFSLVLGAHIPMKGARRYNLEYRFGLGDIPEHKVALSVLFGI